ncbi:GNAT family N-acetyltransferase [Vibrio sp. S9_S30]|uniref:GNAT family N-acetyltransferase n=1 Tax=Vibrio sp. S9_S30 TaxID=2720226 RepID=UPI00168006ED|nr:GNAT family protein [Vibrio sp. S9_S30]MBD1556516.1 GNAT family N-acetyltransferase [Vibrio sp. S9_S30]
MHFSPDFCIITKRIELRLIKNEEVESFTQAIQTSPSLHQWLDWCDHDFSTEDGYDFLIANRLNWLKGLAFGFGIFERETNQFIGMVALTERYLSFNMGCLGYWISDSHQHQGYGKEALDALIECCFSKMKLTRLEIVCDPENIISHKIAEKCGAICEGIARNRFVHNGKPKDGLVYSIIPQ